MLPAVLPHRFDGRSLTPLTTANAYHDVAFSADMAFYVDNYSRVDLPNIMELLRAGDVALAKEVERGDIADFIAAGFKPPEVFVSKGRDGKTDVWGVLMRRAQLRCVEEISRGGEHLCWPAWVVRAQDVLADLILRVQANPTRQLSLHAL